MRAKEVEEALERRVPDKVVIRLDFTSRRILKEALKVYKGTLSKVSFTAIVRRIIEDWDHYRRMLRYYKSIRDTLFTEISELKKSVEELKRENQEIKKLLLECIDRMEGGS